MIYDIISEHLERVETAVLQKHNAASVARWIIEKTTLGFLPYSFKDHEYQETIAKDTSNELVVRKCSQVGISELSVRIALSLTNILRHYSIAYTLPTAHFASTFTKSRIDTVIQGSKELTRNLNSKNDTTEIKQFNDSFLYVKGAASANAPISIPVDHLIHDEYDFCDLEVLGQYASRINHSKWRRMMKFSTPTLPGYGISLEFESSKRHWNQVKCNHCNFWFMPDYYKDVKIPGWDKDLHEISKTNIGKTRYLEAILICPKCGQEPSLQHQHRQYVVENENDGSLASGYQVTPFDAPNVVSIPFLIKMSTNYSRVQDFDNFSLGLPSEDNEATLNDDDFRNVFIQAGEITTAGMNVMGVDVGAEYHFAIGTIDAYDDLTIIHTERVPQSLARKRYEELRKQYRVACTVMDSMPHSETVMALQETDVNMYAAVYVKNKSIVTHIVLDKEEDESKGQAFQRQVNINRSRAFDAYMEFLRQGHLRIVGSEDKEDIIKHHKSMKRVKFFDTESNQLQYTWNKTDGIDHFHHTFLYCRIASLIKGVRKSLVQLPIFSMMKIKRGDV